MEVHINFLAVFLSMVGAMIVGAIWYTPKVLGNTWGKLVKIDMSGDMKGLWKLLLASAVGAFITAYILAQVTYICNQFFHNSFLWDALMTAFWLWLGFIAIRFFTHDIYEKRPWKLTLLNIANELVIVMVMALIIGLLGV